MRAIETHYKGYRFRSRLEARWAVFFDALGIEWDYEPEGFELGNGERYLPDFFLPKFDGGILVEVKPAGGDFSKAKRFAQAIWQDVLCAEGAPDNRSYAVIHTSDLQGFCSSDNCFYDKYLLGTHRYEHRMFWACGGDEASSEFNPAVKRAVDAARSARFELGESGAPV